MKCFKDSFNIFMNEYYNTIVERTRAVMLAAAREVPIIFAAEHGGEEVLGGDDFLPIFVYVVVQAGIPDLRYLQTVLSALCDPDKRLSETGYYVASFEAAVAHIRELPLARVLEEENPFVV